MKKLLIAIILAASFGFVCGVVVTCKSSDNIRWKMKNGKLICLDCEKKQEDSKGTAKNASKDTQGNTEKEITTNEVTVKKGINVVEGLTVVAGTTKCTQCKKEIKEGEKYYIANSKDICSKCFNK